MREAILFVVVCCLLAACAQQRTPLASRNALLAKTESRALPQDALQNALEEDFQAALKSCEERMASLRQNVIGSSRLELGLAAVGIVAGSIIVPVLAAKAAAAKSAIAGWGGLSGATNAAQYMLNEKGSSASAGAAVYEALRLEIREYSAAYNTAPDADAKATAVNGLAIACKFPPLPVFHATSAPQ